jgi:glycosyltransferase involved in cell wall biosynthesis
MIRLFINALAASAGGGLTYVRNVIPHLAARDDVEATVLLSAHLRRDLGNWPNVTFLAEGAPSGIARRFWFEQRKVPSLIRNSRANVLLSAGNFALLRPPVPQILLSRNSLYTSNDFLRDLRFRGDYRLWLDTQVKGAFAKWSIGTAERTVAPSFSFAEELRQWTGRNVLAIHHGFDREAFTQDQRRLPPAVERALAPDAGVLRLLFVSHFNYYRNFETLIRALPRLKRTLYPRKVRLVLTCKLNSAENPGEYRAHLTADLIRKFNLTEDVVELGAIPYGSLHQVYRACDLYVTPAYAESFAHPLVEAMSSGLPVIASDLPVHREICGGAGLFFPTFSPRQLAQRVAEVAGSVRLSAELSEAGRKRAATFSWREHTGQIVALADQLVTAIR